MARGLSWPARFGEAGWGSVRPSAASSPNGAEIEAARAQVWTIHLLLIALWVATHPYGGIIHDGRLYLAQALKAADPNFLAQDLYFAFGSQDAFTRFSGLYARLVNAVGAVQAYQLATVSGQAAFFIALLQLMRALFGDGREFLTATTAAIALSPYYGGAHVFSYGEPFATPRLFTEALVMASLTFGLRGRVLSAALCAGAGLALHPLMALPGIAVLGVLAALNDRRLWLAVPVAFGFAAALALMGVEPFSRALQRFDEAWFDIVLQRSSFAFLSRWTLLDLTELAAKGAIGVMAWRVATASERRVLAVLGATAAAGLAATLLGADVAANVLLANLQPWRSLWLLTVVVNAWTAVVALRLPVGSLPQQLLLFAMVCNAVYRLLGEVDFCSPLIVVIAFMLSVGGRSEARWWPQLRLAAQAFTILLAGIALVTLAFFLVRLSAFEVFSRSMIGAAAGAAALGMLVAYFAGHARASAGSIGVALVLLATAGAVADRRSAWTRFVESGAAADSLSRFVEATGATYWERGLELLWFKLAKPSYYSCLQGTGAMFYAGTAIEFHRRAAVLSGLDTADFPSDGRTECIGKQNPAEDGPLSREQLARACRALPDLDTMVLTHPVPGAIGEEWQPPVARILVREGLTPKRVDSFHKYRCAELRQS